MAAAARTDPSDAVCRTLPWQRARRGGQRAWPFFAGAFANEIDRPAGTKSDGFALRFMCRREIDADRIAGLSGDQIGHSAEPERPVGSNRHPVAIRRERSASSWLAATVTVAPAARRRQ